MKRSIKVSGLLITAILFTAFNELNAQVVVRRPGVTVVRRPVARPYVRPVYRPIARPVVVAPVALPRHYVPVFYGGNPYYYANGVFYVRIEDSESYKVVVPPIGTIVPSLPEGARETMIDDKIYYEYEDIIYKRVMIENIVKYEIVGYSN
ncbi:DUF6515 family protein [Flagellimonas aurea]|uniref:DUF6515 family protein n=1 Tax=Flagellimonas aurea TaxID=2915619 RepID=UPI0035D12B8D